MHILRTLVLAATAVPAAVCHAGPLAADRLVEAAQAELEVRVAEMPGEWEFVADVGMPSHVQGDTVRIQAGAPDGRWPRTRVGVPVQVWADDRPVQSKLVWFTVRRWQEVPVYARDAQAGDALERIRTHTQRRDMAEFGDRPVLAGEATQPGELRLKRSVRTGQPAMQDDFEPVPAVSRQKDVALTVRNGPVTLSTRALAQADAGVGDPVRVLPSGGKQWIRARVTGPGEVAVEE